MVQYPYGHYPTPYPSYGYPYPHYGVRQNLDVAYVWLYTVNEGRNNLSLLDTLFQ